MKSTGNRRAIARGIVAGTVAILAASAVVEAQAAIFVARRVIGRVEIDVAAVIAAERGQL